MSILTPTAEQIERARCVPDVQGHDLLLQQAEAPTELAVIGHGALTAAAIEQRQTRLERAQAENLTRHAARSITRTFATVGL